ncbi:MAG: rRNA adenine dimethylase [Chitinivibrionales bacterium]|nr:rRNA adenine dimethylase [Chitinivibrionales bacterium]
MENKVMRLARTAVRRGLAEPDTPLVGMRNNTTVWNRNDSRIPELEKALSLLAVNSLFFGIPKEPYRTIVNTFTELYENTINPTDWESRVYFHDIPIVPHFSAVRIAGALTKHKAALIAGEGIITVDTVDPEKAYVYYSSVCFAFFVKFFVDYLSELRTSIRPSIPPHIFERVCSFLPPEISGQWVLEQGPFSEPETVYPAIKEVGKLTVDNGLVDSVQGNISYVLDKMIHITRSGAPLDKLDGCIVACPVEGSSPAIACASSELPVHRAIVQNTHYRAILHSHPKFPVILSMDCNRHGCHPSDTCYTGCPYKRYIGTTPVVSGEGGAGEHSISKTVPPAITGQSGVIIYGHGLITVGEDDFTLPFNKLVEIENFCRNEYFRKVARAYE